MDFITQLPLTKAGNDAIVVFVDMLSKMVHFVPTKTNASAPEIARIFFDSVFRLHGLGTKLAMSTAFHPQTDGQTERANRTLEDMLRAYVSYDQKDWDTHLTAAEFACNSAPNASTQMSPFKMNSGREASTPASLFQPVQTNVQSTEEFLVSMSNLTKRAQDTLAVAKARQEKYANKDRRTESFEVGEEVKILQVVSPVAYKLDLISGQEAAESPSSRDVDRWTGGVRSREYPR